MNEMPLSRTAAMLALLTAVSVAVYFGLRAQTGSSYYDFLLWNLFLAWIPFLFSSAAAWFNRRVSNVLLVLLGLGWLLFYPNAPYILTDLIHLTVLASSYTSNGNITFQYWDDLFMILMFAWTALLLGLVSTMQIHQLISYHVSPLAGWLFAPLISWLGAYGILLGREYRLNSWDVFTDPSLLVRILSESLNGQAMEFCALLALLLLLMYIGLYVLIQRGGGRTSSYR